MSEDWLKKWYKDSFSRSSADGLKDETWEKINSQMEDWSGYWYKSNSEKIEVEPKAAVWENLNANLQENAIQKRSARIFLMRTASIAAMFVMIPQMLMNFHESFNYKSESLNVETDDSSALISDALNEKDNTYLIASNDVIEQSFSLEPTTEAQEIREINSNVNVSTANQNLETKEQYNPLAILPIEYINPSINLNILNDNSIRKQKNGLWSVGISANAQHSYLLNAVNRKGLDNESSVKNIVHADLIYNLSVFRKLRNGGILSAKLAINDKKSQSYEDFVGSDYIEKHLELNYQTLGVSYIQPLFKNRLKGALGFEYNAGMFGSYRTNIEEKWGGEDRYILTEGFKKFNLGISTGLDGVYKINKSFDFSVGVYYTNGIMNIFKGTENIPSHFLRTYTSSFGMNAGLRFHL